jgi:hypothetical protein
MIFCENMKMLVNLRKFDLNISNCNEISDQSLAIFGETFKKLKNLKEIIINYSYCAKITEISLCVIID